VDADVVPVRDKEVLRGLVMTRRVVITPLRLILHPPQLEETNRILRQCASTAKTRSHSSAAACM
jgi:hypothetical protein